MNAAAKNAGSQGMHLGDYLLGDRPESIIIVGSQQIDIEWGDNKAVPPVYQFKSLGEVGHAKVSTPASPAVAILLLNSVTDSVDEVLGAAVRRFPDRLLARIKNTTLASDTSMGLMSDRRIARESSLLEAGASSAATPANASIADHRLFAFGFKRLKIVELSSDTTQARWFEYRLSSYKSSPHWLNAQFWANPERFELDEELDEYYDDEDEDEDE
ncbi:MAG: DUF6231 family protein [Granulosicoccus sp.]